MFKFISLLLLFGEDVVLLTAATILECHGIDLAFKDTTQQFILFCKDQF